MAEQSMGQAGPRARRAPWRPAIDVPEMGFDEAMGVLRATRRLGIDPRLESVSDMLAEVGDPDLAFESLQVAGTNGKTSTSRYAAAILRGEGLRVALYTSPELVSYAERMEVGGAPVSEELFAHAISAARTAADRVNAARSAAGQRPYDITEFDLLTVGAMVAFAEQAVDVAVLEVGLGGRWDATSACRSIRSVAVTGIGLDHVHVLGDTLEAIAAEKAAVVREGRACVLGVGTATPDSVEDVFLGRCRDQGVVPVLLRPDDVADAAGEMHPGVPREHAGLPHASYRISSHPRSLGDDLVLDVETPLARHPGLVARKPAYQAANIACAVALAEAHLGRALDGESLRRSVAACPTPGRFDAVRADPLALVDASHNPQSVEAFLTAVRAIEPEPSRRPTLLAAVLADKDAAGIVRLLAPEFPRVVATQTSSPRALAADELAEIFRGEGAEVVATCPTVAGALDALGGEGFVACGSITLAGEVAGLLR